MKSGLLKNNWFRGMLVWSVAAIWAAMAPAAFADSDYADAWGPAVGAPAPLLEANDQDGQARTIESLTGENGLVLVFNRSVDWCPFCKRQFMHLNEVQDQFEDAGVNVVGMTYDDADEIKAFHDRWELGFPMLRDVDLAHVEAWGIRNEAYGEGSFAYGIPHPGVVFLSAEGEILAKFAEPGYRTRADWSDVLEEVQTIVGGGA